MKPFERLPWFRFYPADYLLDTAALDLREHGVYAIAIMRYYWQGYLMPDELLIPCRTEDDREAAKRIMSRFFHLEDGKLVHNRIERELQKSDRYIELQSAKGKASAAARAKKRKTPINGAKANALDGFEAFYASYPRKEARENAERAWAKLKPDTALQVQMIAALEAQKKTPKWLENGGEFIPHPATWINGKRWLDELKPKIEQPKRLAI